MSSRQESQQVGKANSSKAKGEAVLPGVAVSDGKMKLACALAWAFPGAGHLLLGRFRRGLTFMVVIMLMFALGLVMHGHLYHPTMEDKLSIFPSFANVGIGLSYFFCLLAHAVLHLDLGFGAPQAVEATFEYGNTFLWTAGLLNYLVILDAFDIAVGRKR